jgi:hypothetical protein
VREMTEKVDGDQLLLAWIAKPVVLGVAASIVPRVWTSHPHIAFGVGLTVGIVLQHFIPPRGKVGHLCVLLVLAVLGALIAARL